MHHLVYMCRDSFPHFIFEHTCRVILLMENRLFRAAGVFWGVCPCLWLSLALSNVSDRLHIPLSLHVPGMPLCFFLCLCMHHPGRSQVLLLWSSSSFSFLCSCVHLPFSVFFFLFNVSIDYSNPLSQSHLSACDLSNSEFPIHFLLLLLCPHVCSEGGRRSKLRRGTP